MIYYTNTFLKTKTDKCEQNYSLDIPLNSKFLAIFAMSWLKAIKNP